MNRETVWELPTDKQLGLTFSQNQPELTPQLSCPMVTLLRGLRRAAISTLKRSVLARSNSPPSKKIFPLFFKPLEPWRITWILEFVPAPLMSPVTTATLYTIPEGIRNLVRKKRREEKRLRVIFLIGCTLGSTGFPPAFLSFRLTQCNASFVFVPRIPLRNAQLPSDCRNFVTTNFPSHGPMGFLSPCGDN